MFVFLLITIIILRGNTFHSCPAGKDRGILRTKLLCPFRHVAFCGALGNSQGTKHTKANDTGMRTRPLSINVDIKGVVVVVPLIPASLGFKLYVFFAAASGGPHP